MEFLKIKETDREKIDRYLQCDGEISADRCFVSVFVWQNIFGTEYCIEDEMLYIRFNYDGVYDYAMPVGFGNFKKSLKKILKEAEQIPMPCKISNISASRVPEFGGFEIYPERERFDYVYDSESFIELKGKKLHAKRNFINRFKADYDKRWEYRNIDFENDRELVFEFAKDRCDEEEKNALKSAFEHHKSLELYGGILFVDSRVAAYTVASPQNSEVMDIMFERADVGIKGSSQMIANEFARNNCRNYKYINREEDMGIEGLRKAKLSYCPAFLTEKYEVLCPKR